MAKPDPHGTQAAIHNIMKWARRPEWAALYEQVLEEHTGEVLEDFGLESRDALAEAIGEAAFASSVYGPAFEDFLTRTNESEESIVDEYLRRRGFKESAPGRRYLAALGDSVMSLYEVREAVPGSHLMLRDLVRSGETVRVEERSGSRQLVRWDIVATRVVSHNRHWIASGVLLKFEPSSAEELKNDLREIAGEIREDLDQRFSETAAEPDVDFAAAMTEDAALDPGLDVKLSELAGTDDPDALADFVDRKFLEVTMGLALYHAAPLFTRVWLEQTLERLHAPPPELRNYDGEPILWTETRWTIAPRAVSEAAQRLDGAGDRQLYRSNPGEQRWDWEGNKALSRGPYVTVPHDASSEADEVPDRVSLGSIEIDRGVLLLRTNSEGRAVRGRTLLESILAGLLGAAEVSRQDVVAEAWAGRNAPESAAADAVAGPDPTPDIPADEKARLLNEFKNRHYRAWLDMAVPLLGGKTPRQAAADRDREQLVRLLKDLENRELRSARDERLPAYDASWIWRELGLPADAA